MDNLLDELAQVMEAEIELGEALVEVMAQKRRSTVGLQSDQLMVLTQREEELLRPFEDLERERLRLCNVLAGRSDAARNSSPAISVQAVLDILPASDAVRVSTQAKRLKAVVERILHSNEQNRLFLQRSLRFVQEALRLVTEDHTKQLVDQRL